MARTQDPQSVNLIDMDKPALHPDRIRHALRVLRDDDHVSAQDRETFRAALELIRKSQLAVGLTGQVVDAGRSAMDLLEALRRIGK